MLINQYLILNQFIVKFGQAFIVILEHFYNKYLQIISIGLHVILK